MNKILIIDDDRELCALIKRSVQAENIEADFCNTGKEGLQKLREEEYQLVVLDVMMPGLDGIRTTAKLRESCNVPIILLTAKSEDSDKILGLNIGADDYITKPFNPIEVIARVKSQLRRYTSLGGKQGGGEANPPCSPTAASRWMTGPNRSPWTGRGSASPPSSTTSFSC